MSGTSLDGLDLVCVDFKKKKNWDFEILKAKTYSYSSEWKTCLSELHLQNSQQIKEVEKDYVNLLAKFILDFKSDIEGIDFVSSHGHTVFHQPDQGFTLQIGNTPQLSKLIALPLICDFRSQDVELGGQGAPLVPIGDLHLFKSYSCCLNLGGFANVSLPQKAQVTAFDICAVNTVLNVLANEEGLEYDSEGNLARAGHLIPELLSALENLEYYQKKAPKSLGIEWVNEQIFPLLDQYRTNLVEDRIHTYTYHIAKQIGSIFKNTDSVLITGGGAKNNYLISLLNKFSKAKFSIPDPLVVDFKEALIFAFLGLLRIENRVNCLSSVTGASADHSSGNIFYP
jgi:anhydro-N-acetylmuramic acid kinase